MFQYSISIHHYSIFKTILIFRTPPLYLIAISSLKRKCNLKIHKHQNQDEIYHRYASQFILPSNISIHFRFIISSIIVLQIYHVPLVNDQGMDDYLDPLDISLLIVYKHPLLNNILIRHHMLY